MLKCAYRYGNKSIDECKRKGLASFIYCVDRQNTLLAKFTQCIFLYIPYLAKQLFFCDQTLKTTNICRVIRCITKVALLNNFRNMS